MACHVMMTINRINVAKLYVIVTIKTTPKAVSDSSKKFGLEINGEEKMCSCLFTTLQDKIIKYCHMSGVPWRIITGSGWMIRIIDTSILPVILCDCETWSLTLREEHRLRVFENMVLKRIFGPQRD
jgi:hypothetical protein